MLVWLCAIAAAQGSARRKADTLVITARIYTVNSQQPWAEALAISGDKILAVGSAKDMAAYRGPATKVVDAQRRLMLPGFTDCHIHFMDGSVGLTQVDLNGTKSIAEIQKRVKDYSAAHPTEPWITGMGWTYPTSGLSGLPDKSFLHVIAPSRP